MMNHLYEDKPLRVYELYGNNVMLSTRKKREKIKESQEERQRPFNLASLRRIIIGRVR